MSKALKALERIKNAPTIYVGLASDIYTRYSFECKEIEKDLKALEIIKTKKVDVNWLYREKTLEGYNFAYEGTNESHLCLTQEEYDLLKEIFDE